MKTTRHFLRSTVPAILVTALTGLYSCGGGSQPQTPAAIDTTKTITGDTATVVVQNAVVKRNYYGIDISSYQGDEVAEIGPEDSLTFIICKATEGITSVDPDFKTNMNTIKSKGTLCGAYHFYHTGDDPVQQATHFWNTLSPYKADVHIAPIVDIEGGSMPGGKKGNAAKIQQDFKVFLQKLQELSGRLPMIYTGEDFGTAYLTDPHFANYELWLAEYSNAKQPTVPPTWKSKGYKIWQKRDNYTINSTQNDFDLYHGTKSGLTK